MIPAISFPKEFPVLQTERLTLSMAQLKDAAALFELRSDPEFMKYLGRDPMKSLDEAEDYIRKIHLGFEEQKGISWKISEKGNDQFIGYLGFWEIDYQHYKTEIGYGIHPNYQKKGYMKEALARMIRHAFNELYLHSIKADIDPLNEGSKKLLLSCGFRKNAYVRENYYYNGKFLDSEYYGIIAGDL